MTANAETMKSVQSPASAEARFDRISEANLRLEAVVDLTSAVANDDHEIGDALDGLLDDLADDCATFHTSLEPLLAICRAQSGSEEEIPGILFRQGLLGLAVKFATPVFDFSDDSTYTWGCYHTGWVYAETYEAAWELGFEWAAWMKAKDRETAKSNGSASTHGVASGLEEQL